MDYRTKKVVPFMRPQEYTLTILAVEDDKMQRIFLEEQIKTLGHKVMQATNGQEALDILALNGNDIDVILMDRMMPVMDGLTAVQEIKQDIELRKIPIVMVTAAAGKKDIQEGLDAGVFYYLTKPVDDTVLRSVLMAATREAKQNRTLNDELRKHRSSFNLIHTCKFEFRTLVEAECLSAFMAHCFPDPERVLPGLAELMINAVEHGNLQVGYEQKGALLERSAWRDEIERRQSMDVYKDRVVEVMITRKDGGVYAIITDQGEGFDWKQYMTIDPSRASDNHGRGIAQANTISFDRLTYNSKGNQVVGYVGKQSNLERR